VLYTETTTDTATAMNAFFSSLVPVACHHGYTDSINQGHIFPWPFAGYYSNSNSINQGHIFPWPLQVTMVIVIP